MFYRSVFSLLAISSLFADPQQEPSQQTDVASLETPSCGKTPPPYRVQLRHIEGHGIGYSQGYTTLDLFATPAPLLGSLWTPFIDGRVHVFNNGRVATNIGLGLRYQASHFVYGVNTYYDYRETVHQKYNQLGFGFEALGKVFDFRIGGYFPLGSTTSDPYGTPRFSHFSGNNAYFSRTEEFAMTGGNAEVGIHIKKMKYMEFYGAFGPYYFGGKSQNAAGGKVRAYGLFLNHVKLEGSVSYDPIFRWIGQGELSLVLPFGPRKAVRQRSSCSREMRLHERALQPIDRSEIIVVSHHSTTEVSSNPLTAQPYHFLFINNTSTESLGTFEAPYSTLMDAENISAPHDIFYIFEGDGTTKGMDEGIILIDNQRIFGSGMAHPLLTTNGGILIPKMTEGLPKISHPEGSVILLSSGCEVAGIHILRGVGPSINTCFVDPSFKTSTFIRDTVISGTSSDDVNSTTLEIQNINEQISNPTTYVTLADLGYHSDAAEDLSFFTEEQKGIPSGCPYGELSQNNEIAIFNTNITSDDIGCTSGYQLAPSPVEKPSFFSIMSDTVSSWFQALWGSKQQDEPETD